MKEKELAGFLFSLTSIFSDEISPNDNVLLYKKGGSRQRAYIGRKAANANEAEQRRTTRKNLIEQGRIPRHKGLIGEETENEGISLS